jgi:ribosomal-protein-alanine N-acetyltransferase
VFAGSDPKPCGFVLSRRVADEAEILSVAVAAETRGRGYAGALLAHHLDLLSRHGVRTVHLEVEEGNDPALALYRRHGFEEVGRRPGYYAKPDGATAAGADHAQDAVSGRHGGRTSGRSVYLRPGAPFRR